VRPAGQGSNERYEAPSRSFFELFPMPNPQESSPHDAFAAQKLPQLRYHVYRTIILVNFRLKR
jgi:hypothetical protein